MPYHNDIGHQETDTSLAAAQSVEQTAANLRANVFRTLAEHGPMTADQTANVMGLSILSIRPRFTELRAAGEIHDTGDRSRNASGRRAIIWKAGRSNA